MIKITIYHITKGNKDLSDKLCDEFATMCGHFSAKVSFVNLACKAINLSQKQDKAKAQSAYTAEFLKVSKPTQYRIALSPNGEMLDSIAFANMLNNEGDVAWFVGGAYGLEDAFLSHCQRTVSLSRLTLSHKVARVMLAEQIYRALCLLNNHPYHKE